MKHTLHILNPYTGKTVCNLPYTAVPAVVHDPEEPSECPRTYEEWCPTCCRDYEDPREDALAYE